jgi:hypothetical protein
MRPASRERGQSMVEYTVVCAAIAACLFVPIGGNGDPASPDRARTAAEILIDGLRSAYQRISFALSLPT